MTTQALRRRPAAELADEIIARRRAFEALAFAPGPTPLEELRRELRRRERPARLRRVLLGTAARVPIRAAEVPSVGEAYPANVRQRKRAAVALAWRGAALAAGLAVPLHLVAPTATDTLARRALALVPNGAITEIDAARVCAMARPILDASGALVGVAPRQPCPGGRPFLSAPVAADAAARMHLVWRAIEGEYRVAPSTISGLNIKGWGRAALQQVRLMDGRSGGSSPLETAIKGLRGRPGKLPAMHKLRSGFDTLTYTARRLADDADRDRFVNEATICISGAAGSAFGYDLAGALCPAFLFAKSAEELDWAEMCIWGATANRLYRPTGNTADPVALAQAEASRNAIRNRARDRCIGRLGNDLGWTAQEIVAWQARVDSVAFPAQRQRQVPAPEAVDLHATVPALVYPLRDELRLAAGAAQEDPIQLAVSAEAQRMAHARVMQAAGLAEPRLASGLCLIGCDEGSLSADLLAVLAEIDGDRLLVRLAVANGHHLLSGPIARSDDGFRRARTDRSVGSTNKAWLLSKLIAAGHRQLCNEVPVGASSGISEPTRQPCASGQGLVDLRSAIAPSLNAPFADAVLKLGIGPTKTYFQALGFDFDPDLAGSAFVNSLVLGYGVTAAPATLMRNMAGLYRGSRGEPPVSSLPAIITGTAPSKRFDWRDAGIGPDELREAAALLAAPIIGRNGTLRSLAPVLARHGCFQGIGKTGTSDSTVPNAVRDKIVVAAFQCGNRTYVAYGLIGSPTVNVPLGRVQAGDVVRLIDALLETHTAGQETPR